MTPRARRGRRIDGVLLLDKPPGISSNAALQRARRLFDAERAGHTGTLDPMAEGLLVLCFGDATKFAGELLGAGKSYTATLKLGVRTATGDAEGDIVARRPVSVTEDQFRRGLEIFRGDISQVPPMYSALKREGRPLYQYARKGIEVERLPRKVTVSSLELVSLTGGEAVVAVSCSKGTYVRTLAEDIGEALGCGAHLTRLIRTAIGSFRLEQAHQFEDLESRTPEQRAGMPLPVDVLVRDLPDVLLSDPEETAFTHGRSIDLAGTAPGRIRVYGQGGRFLGLGQGDEAGRLIPKRLLAAA